VAAGGGAISPLVDLDPARGEHAILWPQELPGGKGLLAIVVRGRDFQDIASAEAVVLEPGSWKRRVVLEGCSFARYLPGGYILFLRGSSLFVVGFDARRLEVVGAPQRVSEPITVLEGWQTPHFAVSKDGTLFYASGPPVRQTRNRLVSLDEAGRPTPLPLPPGRNGHPKLSPDGKRIVVARYEGSTLKLSVFERDRQVLSALTPEPGRTFCPAWSPDGRQVAYSFFHQSHPRLAIKAADGSGERRHPTPRTEDAEFVNSWSPDDQWIAYTLSYNEDRGGTRQRGTSDIWLLSLEELKARPWFETPFREIGAEFSPDGRWIAYVSDETGRNEVYVRPFPGPGGRLKVSAEGGNEPTWWKGGREVLFRKDDAFLTAEFRPGTEASAGAPRPLFEARLDRGGREDFPRQYDVARDGSEIIAVESDPEQPVERQLAIVTGWTSGVARGQKSK
jgi:serine/threonine-protein kinase